MKKISIFQIIILSLAVVGIGVGVYMFSTAKTRTQQQSAVVTMWGVMDADTINELTRRINSRASGSINIIYKQFNIDVLETELLEALASGVGPDLVLLPVSSLSKHDNKLLTIPYESFPKRNYKDTFIESTEILLKEDGLAAIPFSIDPLVLYWNRTLFTKASISTAPSYWDQVLATVPSLTEKDSEFNVSKSAIALGEFRNITNAKEILSTLMLQAGTPIMVRTETGLQSVLNQRYGYKIRPAEAAISFYTQFANPIQNSYTWNRSLLSSQDMFVSGDLAMYIGFASEYDFIQKRNPNLNFDVALMPKSRSGTADIYSNINTIAITKQTANTAAAFNAMISLVDKATLEDLEEIEFLPPIRRDMLNNNPSDEVMSIFYSSSLRSRSVLDPDPTQTEKIYQSMVESFVSGRTGLPQAVDRANAELNNVIK
jgi:ABC-type glycerol-3-phosphate transport system substrate-binding protein